MIWVCSMVRLGIPGWRQGSAFYKMAFVLLLALTFPLTSLVYILVGPFFPQLRILKNPFVKYVNHCASYFGFIILIFAGVLTNQAHKGDEIYKRSRPPNISEWMLVAYVFSFIVAEAQGSTKLQKNS